jgi:hypothetical protein
MQERLYLLRAGRLHREKRSEKDLSVVRKPLISHFLAEGQILRASEI